MVPGMQLSTSTGALIIPGRQLSTFIGALIILGRQLGGGIVIHLHLRVRTKRIVRHAMYLGRHIAINVWNRYLSSSVSAASLYQAIRLTYDVSPLPVACAEKKHALVK